jgi:hypothetical protein
LFGPFDFDIVSFAPKHFLRSDRYREGDGEREWVACLGDLSLFNPVGSLLSVDLDMNEKRLQMEIPLVSKGCFSLAISSGRIVSSVEIVGDSSNSVTMREKCTVIASDKESVMRVIDILVDSTLRCKVDDKALFSSKSCMVE